MPRHARGFTLIELLMVIAIIGLLVTLLVPAIAKITDMVRVVQTNGIIKEISFGLEDFRKDFGDYPPSRPTSYFGGTQPKDVYMIAGTKAGKPEKVAGGDLGTGAANLLYYLYGPDRVGWGTVGGGAMPFGGPPQRAYGPYYQCGEDRLRFETLTTPITVRGQSLSYLATGFLDAYKPPGVILYLKSYKREMTDASGILYTIQGYDPSDNDRPDVRDPGGGSVTKTSAEYTKYNYGEPTAGRQQEMFDLAVGVWAKSSGQTRTQIKRYPRQDYILVSPGPDGRYGFINQDTFQPWDPNTGDSGHDSKAQNDDVGNWGAK